MEQHKISMWTAVLMNINIMVGVGIFVLPPLMTQKAGYASFLAWPIVALIVMPVVLSIATMARLFPGAGSFYTYCKNIIGPDTGFISGWAYYLGYTGVASIMAICFRDDIALKYININPILFNLLFVLFISIMSMLNIKTIGKIQNAGTFVKILPMIAVLTLFLAYWNPSFTLSLPSLKNVPSVIPFALFGFWGFEVCCTISHLIKGDKRNASRAIMIAFFTVAFLYSMFHFGALHIMGAENLAAAGNARDFVDYLNFTPYMKALFSSFITFTIGLVFVNAVFSIFTATSSMLQAMGSENVIPFGKHLTKQSKQQRPWVAIAIQGLLTFAITCSTSNKSILVSMINIGILVAFLLTLIALLVLQLRTTEKKGIWLSIIALVSWVVLAYFSWNDIGATHSARIIASIPLMILFAIGYGMYRYRRTIRIPENLSS